MSQPLRASSNRANSSFRLHVRLSSVLPSGIQGGGVAASSSQIKFAAALRHFLKCTFFTWRIELKDVSNLFRDTACKSTAAHRNRASETSSSQTEGESRSERLVIRAELPIDLGPLRNLIEFVVTVFATQNPFIPLFMKRFLVLLCALPETEELKVGGHSNPQSSFG